MRYDDLIDDLARRMADEDFGRFLEIRELLQGHAQSAQELEAELELLVIKYRLVGDEGHDLRCVPPTIKDFNQEARADPDIGPRSLPYLRLSDLRRLVQPQPHGLHNIDDGAACEILASLRTQQPSQ